ncbi:MAG: MmcQ/YjbR family DNA-binding protein [Clostridiaceae bacterium]|nr:MmcQ/YjbR family DNA-binding protein [Clostridiaceae bacterium]
MNPYDWIDAFLLSMPGAVSDFKEEWQWQRYLVGGKMFAALMHPSSKYDPMYAEKDIVNLKSDPMLAELLRAKYPGAVMPGFYTDKRCWNSVDLGADIPEDELKQMCEESYRLVFEKLTKKLQHEILEGTK